MANLAEEVEVEGISFVGLVVDVLELDCGPVFQAFLVDIASGAHTSAGGHIGELVVLFF